jgi:hypothetical protein
MSKLTDPDIVRNYVYSTTGRIDDGEEMNCSRCGKRSTIPGVRSHGWTRVPNKGTHLPRSIELCDSCQEQILELMGLLTD